MTIHDEACIDCGLSDHEYDRCHGAPVKHALEAMLALTDEQRHEIIGQFCRGCGWYGRQCQCWNDD